MAKGELFSGESKNIEYKVAVPDKSEKIYENSCCFCQYARRKVGYRY